MLACQVFYSCVYLCLPLFFGGQGGLGMGQGGGENERQETSDHFSKTVTPSSHPRIKALTVEVD